MDNDKGPVSYSQFACVGSGFAAIALGAQLKRWYGITDVRFFERYSDLGGTWFANKYPGCACDVPSVLYSFSFEPNPCWSRALASHEELWAYLKSVAAKYDLPQKMTFGVTVERCEWLEGTQRWRMYIRHRKTDQVLVHECQFLFAGTGQLVEPRQPDLPGIDNFRGPVFHAARWRADVDLTDRRVAVFGNGCTGAQIVPRIVERTRHLTHYTRSKHWILPPPDVRMTPAMQAVFKYVPGALLAIRIFAFWVMEDALQGFQMDERGAAWRRRKQASVERYMRRMAPDKYHDLLIPDFEIGCKRRIFDPQYLKSLHSENLTLTDEPVVEVLPDGIRTKSGVAKTDVIVMANGYSTNQFMPGIEIVGRNGSVSDHWSKFGGPEAYNCTMLSGFPNFFMMLGPNTATGHTSAIMAVENSVNYALRVIKPILDGSATAADVKLEAEMQYSEKMQAKLKHTVWNGCSSWYVKTDESGEKWNAHTYPYPQAQFWYSCLFPKWSDFVFTPSTAARGSSLSTLIKVLRLTALIAFGATGATLIKRLGLQYHQYLPFLRSNLQDVWRRIVSR